MIRKFGRSLLNCILTLVLVLSLPLCAYASQGIVGSISVTLRDSETREPIPGGSLFLYPVADLVDGKYVPTSSFADFGGSLEDLNAPGLAAELYAHGKGHSPYIARQADRNGLVIYDKRPQGLYLIAQQDINAAKGYYPIDPFLVTIPMWDAEKGEWDYTIDASPKAETRPDGTEPTSPPDKPHKPPLIQTGQLNWPVPVLAGLGIVLFTFGWVLYNKREKHEP